MKYKDESNARIVQAMDKISKIMEQEKRGFIFAPIVQAKGNHRTMCCVSFQSGGELGEKEITQFWATLATIIENVQIAMPEDSLQEFKNGFMPFVQMVAERCFPTIKLYGVV